MQATAKPKMLPQKPAGTIKKSITCRRVFFLLPKQPNETSLSLDHEKLGGSQLMSRSWPTGKTPKATDVRLSARHPGGAARETWPDIFQWGTVMPEPPVESSLQRLLESQKKFWNHCGVPSQVLNTSSPIVNRQFFPVCTAGLVDGSQRANV